MVAPETAREALAEHGKTRSQLPQDWGGGFPVPESVVRFYRDVGPVDVTVDSYGNPYFFPRFKALWEFQAGYRWDGLSRERIEDWEEDWLVIADCGGDPFVLSRSSGAVLHGQHGMGSWELTGLFPDLNTMAACLGRLGTIVNSAGEEFTDEDCLIRPEYRAQAWAQLRILLGEEHDSANVLANLGWA